MLVWMVVVLSISSDRPLRVLPEIYPTEEDCQQDVSAIEDVNINTEYVSCRLVPKPEPKKG
jgi:hypothetical protein